MKRKANQTTLIALVVVALLFFGSLNSYAMAPFKAKQRKLQDLIVKLDLTEQQRQELDDLFLVNSKKRAEIKEKLRQQLDALYQELAKPKLDAGKLKKTAAKVKAYKNQLADIRINNIINVNKILTEEQYIKLQEMSRKKSFWDKFRRPRDKPACFKEKEYK